MNTEKYFKLAKNVSELSDYNKKNIKIGAVLVYKNRIIGTGYNTNKTSPIQMKYNKYRETDENNRSYVAEEHLPFLHAEMSCLLGAKDLDIDWNKASIFVYRESDGKLRNCRCCSACMKALKDKGVKNIYYTTEDGYCHEKIIL